MLCTGMASTKLHLGGQHSPSPACMPKLKVELVALQFHVCLGVNTLKYGPNLKSRNCCFKDFLKETILVFLLTKQ